MNSRGCNFPKAIAARCKTDSAARRAAADTSTVLSLGGGAETLYECMATRPDFRASVMLDTEEPLGIPSLYTRQRAVADLCSMTGNRGELLGREMTDVNHESWGQCEATERGGVRDAQNITFR